MITRAKIDNENTLRGRAPTGNTDHIQEQRRSCVKKAILKGIGNGGGEYWSCFCHQNGWKTSSVAGLADMYGLDDVIAVARSLPGTGDYVLRAVRVAACDSVAHDPADGAAWPLPEGWEWRLNGGSPMAYRRAHGGVCIRDEILLGGGHVPLAVLDVLRARWEAGRA